MRNNSIQAYSLKKERERESLKSILIAGCYHGETGRRLIRSQGESMCLVMETKYGKHIGLSLACLKLKNGANSETGWSSPDALGSIVIQVVVSPPDWLLQRG